MQVLDKCDRDKTSDDSLYPDIGEYPPPRELN